MIRVWLEAMSTASPPWEAEPLPTNTELLRLTLGNLARNPFKAMRVEARIVRQLADAAGIHGLSSAATQAGAAIKRIAQPGGGDRPTVALLSLDISLSTPA